MYNGPVGDFTRRIDTQREGKSTTTWYFLEGTEGVVQFMILFSEWRDVPLPADVGYHARTPQYDGQSPMGGCKELGGDTCYYDGSGLLARDLYDKFLAGGQDPEIIWSELKSFYNDTFR